MNNIMIANLNELVLMALKFSAGTGPAPLETTAFITSKQQNGRHYATITVGPLSIPNTRLVSGYSTTELVRSYERTVRDAFKKRRIDLVNGVYGFIDVDDIPLFSGSLEFFKED